MDESHSNSLRVFLRVRPRPIAPSSKANPKTSKTRQLNTKKQSKSCLIVNDYHSVTISPPCDSTRLKSELYNGFAHVFCSESSQDEVYEKLMRPIVEEFLSGKSGLLAALGPSGSGKTHTIFGSAKDPGLLPRALDHIFNLHEQNGSKLARSFYMSMFEIYSEKGKGEKLTDLSPDGADICMQQSVVKGLKEVLVTNVAQAESLIARAKLKRATATTNSNSQSSRSQCIINIRCVDEIGGESECRLNSAILTFVDLAGAEREKKTGNQGGRLLESNFINNTSMIFGLCLRSLLEHQKNPKKPLQKHFQSSLLTRYLRDYLEGRKRMALILTVRSGEEDYFDTSFLLRQASPYMEIKFHNMEETSNLPGIKRRYQTTCTEQQKRAKLSDADVRKNYAGKTIGGSNDICKEVPIGYERDQIARVNSNSRPEANCPDAKIERGYHVMCGFAKALWNALKQYKDRVKAMQNEIDVLTENLRIGHDQYLAMEKQLCDLKSQCSCHKRVNPESRVSAVKEWTDHGKLAVECDEVGPAAREEKNKCSTSEIKGTLLLQEEHMNDHSEVSEILASEVGCQWNDSERSSAEIPGLEEEIGCGDSLPTPVGSEKHQGPGSTDIRKVLPGDFPTSTKCFESVDKNSECGGILRKSSQGATFSSLDLETFAQQSYQHSATECEILNDHVNGHDYHKKDLSKNYDKESTDAAACLPQPHVMTPMVQGGTAGCKTHGKEDKENVVMDLRSDIIELETNQTSLTRPLNTERPRRRLMPASSLLLRDVSGIDIAYESEKPKRGRGGKRLVEDQSQKTRGNASLLRLLKNHLPR